MDVVLCLSHFCEKHGPRVMFCTQYVELDALAAVNWEADDAPSETGDAESAAGGAGRGVKVVFTPARGRTSSHFPVRPTSPHSDSKRHAPAGDTTPTGAAAATTGDAGIEANTTETRTGAGAAAAPAETISGAAEAQSVEVKRLSGGATAPSRLVSPNAPSTRASSLVSPAAGALETQTYATAQDVANLSQAAVAAGICASCASIDLDACFASQDDDNSGSCYVSTARPGKELYSRLQEISLRAITHELSPGMEGPVLFGDEERGFALSYNFKIADFKARGYARMYSFIIYLGDHCLLATSWPFLTSTLRQLVQDLQARANRVFNHERTMASMQAEAKRVAQAAGHPTPQSPSGGSTSMPGGPGGMGGGGGAGALNRSGSRGGIMNNNLLHGGPGRGAGRRQGGPAVPQRALTELTGTKSLFSILHGRMAWTLRGCLRRYTEVTRQTQMKATNLNSDNSMSDTRSVATGVPPSPSPRKGPGGFGPQRTITAAAPSAGASPIKAPEKSTEEVAAARARAHSAPTETNSGDATLFRVSRNPVLRGNVVLPRLTSLTQARELLKTGPLATLIYNIIIGNQMVARGDDVEMVLSLIGLGKSLLPPGCCQVVEYADAYQDRWRCNFLGASPLARIPTYVTPSSHVLVDISSEARDPTSGKRRITVDDFRFVVVGEHKPTTFGASVDHILAQDMPEEMKAEALDMLRAAWIDKAKICFKFAKTHGLTDDKIKVLTRALDVTENDIAVLRFWMSGLDKSLRQRTLLSGT